ncbi:MAG: helix-turn-helix transcriptional regulator [Hyphomonadaceae bacterium]
MVIDFEAARRIGVPVLVLKEEALEDPLWRRLSARERDVVRLIADGKRNAEIAGALCISLSTVKDHVHNALTKTGLASRAALAAMVR